MPPLTFDDVLAKPAPRKYMPGDRFGSELAGAVPGSRLTGGYRSPQRESQLRAQGAATVPPGHTSAHSRGDPSGPGAEDFTAPGSPDDVLSRTRKLPGVRSVIYEGPSGGQGAHFHVDMSAGPVTFDDVLSAPPTKSAAPTAKPKPSSDELALQAARKPTSEGGMVVPKGQEGMRQFNRQLTMGGDEALGAAMFAGKSQVPRLIGKDPGYGPGQAYNAARTAEEEETTQRSSKGNTAAGVAGGLAGMATGGTELKAAGAALKAGEGLLPRLLPAAKQGAVYGATGGALGSERYQDIPKSAVAGGVFGALTGPVSEALLSGGKLATQAFHTATNNKFGSAAEAAANKLRLALYKDGVRGADQVKAMEKWAKNGVDQTLLDLGGKHTQKLIREAGGGGAAQHVLRRYEDKTEQQAVDQSVSQAKKMVGEQRPAAEVRKFLEDQRRKVAQQKYPRQQSVQVDYTSVISALRDPELRTALNAARKDAVLNRDHKTAQDVNAVINLVRMSENEDPKAFANYLRQNPQKAMAGTLDAIQSAFERTAAKMAERGNSKGARGIYQRAEEISGLLNQVPELKDARATYRKFSEMIDGFDKGAAMLKEHSADTAEADFRAMGKGAKQTARIGMRQALTETLEGNTQAALKNLASNQKTRRVLTAMFGSDEADRFARAADYRLEKMANARKAAGGPAPSAGHSVGFMTHSPIGAAKHAVLKGAEGMARGMSEKEAQAVASLGTTSAKRVLPRLEAKPEPRRNMAAGAARRAVGQTTAGAAKYDRKRKKIDENTPL